MKTTQSSDMVEESFTKGEFVFKEGAWGNRVYEIQSGEILIYKDGVSGNLVPLGTLGPGEMFGEMFLFSTDHRRNATAVAVSEVVVRLYPQSEIVKEIEALNTCQKKLVTSMNQKILHITEHYVEHITEMIPEEVEHLAFEELEDEDYDGALTYPTSQSKVRAGGQDHFQNKKALKPSKTKKKLKSSNKVQVSHDRVRRKPT